MSKNCTMAESSSVRIEEDDEIELSLGLSIGGSFRKTEQSKPNSTNSCAKIDTDLDIYGSECVDTQTKREVQARKNNGDDDKIWLEGQRLRNRVREREMRENEDTGSENRFRKGKNEIINMRDLNLTLNQKVAQSSNPKASSSSTPEGYFCPVLKFVPFTIGFGYHPNFVVPGWDPNMGSFGSQLNVIRPVVCRSFQVDQYSGHGGREGGNLNAVSNGSNGSPVQCSPAGSDHRSKSQQGGSSSDTGSLSCHSQQENHQQNGSVASDPQEQSEHSSYSSQIESTQIIKKTTNFPEKLVSPNTIQPGGINSENPISGPLKRDNGDLGKPPKPQTGNQDTLSMSQMPCISTTGNGPNGKTITGFLYRYTKTEVSIICVCHGSSFSPAEFVKHAGGNDISHPLRHITVIPSAFG